MTRRGSYPRWDGSTSGRTTGSSGGPSGPVSPGLVCGRYGRSGSGVGRGPTSGGGGGRSRASGPGITEDRDRCGGSGRGDASWSVEWCGRAWAAAVDGAGAWAWPFSEFHLGKGRSLTLRQETHSGGTVAGGSICANSTQFNECYFPALFLHATGCRGERYHSEGRAWVGQSTRFL